MFSARGHVSTMDALRGMKGLATTYEELIVAEFERTEWRMKSCPKRSSNRCFFDRHPFANCGSINY